MSKIFSHLKSYLIIWKVLHYLGTYMFYKFIKIIHCHRHLSSTLDLLLLSLSHVWLFVTSWTAACQASLSTISWIVEQCELLKFTSIELVMLSDHLIFCHPLLLLPSIFPSIRVFYNESALHIRWPRYWSFSINPPNEYSELISFRMDWFDLLAVWSWYF